MKFNISKRYEYTKLAITLLIIFIIINITDNPVFYVVTIMVLIYMLVIIPIVNVIKNRITDRGKDLIFYVINRLIKISFILILFLNDFDISYEIYLIIGAINLYIMYYTSGAEDKIIRLREENELKELVDVNAFKSEEDKLRTFYSNYVELNNKRKHNQVSYEIVSLDSRIEESRSKNYIYSIISLMALLVSGILYYLFMDKFMLTTSIVLSITHPIIVIYTSENKSKFLKNMKGLMVLAVNYLFMMFFYLSPLIITPNETSLYKLLISYTMFIVLGFELINNVNEESSRIKRILTEKQDRKIRVEMMNEQIKMQEELLYNKGTKPNVRNKEITTNKYGGIIS